MLSTIILTSLTITSAANPAPVASPAWKLLESSALLDLYLFANEQYVGDRHALCETAGAGTDEP
jgi:hypothetical protein